MTKEREESAIAKEIRLERVFPDDLQSYFVSNIVVQHRTEHFVLSFFEVWPPPLLGKEEDRQKALEELDSIEARCVARLVVTPNTMREFVEVMSDNLEQFEEMTQVLEALDDEETET